MKGASGFVPSFFNIAELDKHAHSVSLSGQTSHWATLQRLGWCNAQHAAGADCQDGSSIASKLCHVLALSQPVGDFIVKWRLWCSSPEAPFNFSPWWHGWRAVASSIWNGPPWRLEECWRLQACGFAVDQLKFGVTFVVVLFGVDGCPNLPWFGLKFSKLRSQCRNAINAAESKRVEEHEAKAQEHAARVMQATLDQLRSQLEADLVKLRSQLPSRKSQAMETALDVKYLRDRQAQLGPMECGSGKDCPVVLLSLWCCLGRVWLSFFYLLSVPAVPLTVWGKAHSGSHNGCKRTAVCRLSLSKMMVKVLPCPMPWAISQSLWQSSLALMPARTCSSTAKNCFEDFVWKPGLRSATCELNCRNQSLVKPMAPAQVRSLQCRCDYLAELDPVHGGLPQFAPECLLPEPLQCGACANSPLPSSHVHASSHEAQPTGRRRSMEGEFGHHTARHIAVQQGV